MKKLKDIVEVNSWYGSNGRAWFGSGFLNQTKLYHCCHIHGTTVCLFACPVALIMANKYVDYTILDCWHNTVHNSIIYSKDSF